LKDGKRSSNDFSPTWAKFNDETLQIAQLRCMQAEKPAAHFSTFGFCRNTNPTQKNQKS
jgi:hypothetical protein